ncbi:MAG: helix-hairpin-helix domain-containing protein [Phycisphaerae bacterium]
MGASPPTNATVAETLKRVADLLEQQEDAAHRARSYRRAAGIVRDADRPMAEVLADEGEDGLPIMKTERRGWSFTVLYSNTARAHERGKTRDWVVIYYASDGGREEQCTVITAERGPLQGRRVIPGRRKACRDFYKPLDTNAD